jgi:hypothetical protein
MTVMLALHQRITLTDTSGQNVSSVSLKRDSFSGNWVSLSAIAFRFRLLAFAFGYSHSLSAIAFQFSPFRLSDASYRRPATSTKTHLSDKQRSASFRGNARYSLFYGIHKTQTPHSSAVGVVVVSDPRILYPSNISRTVISHMSFPFAAPSRVMHPTNLCNIEF